MSFLATHDSRTAQLMNFVYSELDEKVTRTTHGVESVEDLKSKLLSNSTKDAAKARIADVIKVRFSGLILVPSDKIEISESIQDFGVDSLLSSKLRAWLHRNFKAHFLSMRSCLVMRQLRVWRNE
jgi:hypothetical protein